MSDVNRRVLLRKRPTGRIDDRTFEFVEEAVPEIGGDEALVRTRWISLDPTNRAWIGETPTYLPPVDIGEVMRAPSARWPPSSRRSRAHASSALPVARRSARS